MSAVEAKSSYRSWQDLPAAPLNCERSAFSSIHIIKNSSRSIAKSMAIFAASFIYSIRHYHTECYNYWTVG